MRFKNTRTYAICSALFVALMFSQPTMAADSKKAKAGKSKVYDEQQFLAAFGGKSRKQVSEILGAPIKKEQSVKPANAESMLMQAGRLDKSKPVNVEMWYYNNIVTYDGKRTYKSTELTFVNDRVQNIGFFNNK